VKLVGSGKLKSGVDKGDMRGKKGRLKKKKPVKHEREIVILLTFLFYFIFIFLNLSRSLYYSLNL
jgi:hypothetical protein